MNPIAELIARLLDEATATDELAGLDDEQLAAARQQLSDHARSIRAGEVEGTDPDDVEALTSIRDAVQVVRAEQAQRAEVAAQAEADAAARAGAADDLAAEILVDDEADAEVEDPEDPEVVAEVTDPEPEPEPVVEPEPEPVTAATTPTPARRRQRPPMAALINARPEAARPRPNEMVARPRWQLRDGTAADAADMVAIGERMIAARADLLEAQSGIADKVTVASIKLDFPSEMRIDHTDSPYDAAAKIDAIVAAASDPEAVTASGGWCAPREPRYEIPDVANASRPFRDSLPQIGADRGGIQFVRAARLSSITTGGPATANAGVNLWTAAVDATPGGSTKQRQTIACRTVQTADLDAVLYRLRFGNMQAKAFPEDMAHNIALARAAHARVADKNLLDRLLADVNIDVTQTGFTGTARDLKHHLLQAKAQIKYVERLGDAPRIRAVLAREALDMTLADVTMQQPGDDTLTHDEAWARQVIASSGVESTYVWDVPTGAETFVTNADNQNLADFPDTLEIPVFIDGTVVYLNGGQLDLGIVRDSTLNNTNDFEIFVETFEGLAWLGPFALNLLLTTCPAGDSQAASSKTSALCSGS